MFGKLKALFGTGVRRTEPNPEDEPSLIYIALPEPLDPIERGDRFEDPLDAELQLAGLGCVSGGGTLMSAPDEDGGPKIISCGIDVDANDVERARGLLREHLPELGCPTGTKLSFSDAEGDWEDVFDGGRWSLRQPGAGPKDRL